MGVLTAVGLLVAVVHLGGDFLLELRKLVLRECARQDLRAPLDQVIDHVTHGVEHFSLVSLCVHKQSATHTHTHQ